MPEMKARMTLYKTALIYSCKLCVSFQNGKDWGLIDKDLDYLNKDYSGLQKIWIRISSPSGMIFQLETEGKVPSS